MKSFIYLSQIDYYPWFKTTLSILVLKGLSKGLSEHFLDSKIINCALKS